RFSMSLELVEFRDRVVDLANESLIFAGQIISRRFRCHLRQRVAMLPVMLPQQLDLSRALTAPYVHRAEIVGHSVHLGPDICKKEARRRIGELPKSPPAAGTLNAPRPAAT